jgi:H/ACA ribonucleoprotein complex subunit 4
MEISKSILLLDKPSGMTSFECVERVEKILKVEKAGHTGTLDPNVTGLLVIAIGEARKAMPFFSRLDKEYVGKMILHKDENPEKIKSVFKRFVGEIEQIPPVKSRVARKPRKRKIYEFEILSISGREISFCIKCEAGTYIRKLCHDIGVELGTGAHMIELRRTKVGEFSIENSVSLKDLENGERKKGFISLEEALDKLKIKKIIVKNDYIDKIKNGMQLAYDWAEKIDKDIKNGDLIGFFNKGKIIAIGVSKMDFEHMKKGFLIAKTDRVFKF